jgi:hypothetical protein
MLPMLLVILALLALFGSCGGIFVEYLFEPAAAY